MSGFADKIKGVVRSRSKSRNSQSFDNTRNSDDLGPRKSYEAKGRDGQRSRVPDSPTNTEGISRDFRSLNIDDQNAPTNSKTLPPLPTDANQRINQAATRQSMDDQRPLSLHSVPPRTSSAFPRKPVGSITPPRSPTDPTTRGHRSNRSMDVAPSDPSAFTPQQTTSLGSPDNTSHVQNFQNSHTGMSSNGSSGTRGQTSNSYSTNQSATSRAPQQTIRGVPSEQRSTSNIQLPEHVKLPPGFNLRNGTETVVDTAWQPMVTQETVRVEKTDVVQPLITRDVHVDHYYHYTQPIKVVEILPAKHYRLDERTGEKIEIPAPEGFELPEHMRPGPIQQSDLQAITRHYVVDEQNPHGRPEDPPSPLRNKHDVRELHYDQRSQR